MVFPLLVYAAMRLSPPGAALVALEVALITVLATLAVLFTLLVSAVTGERTSALAELADAERRTRLILDTAQQAFVSVDAEDRIADWNPMAEEVFGWKRDEILGRTVAETLVAEHRRPGYRRAFAGLLGAGDSARGSLREEMMCMPVTATSSRSSSPGRRS